MGNICCCFRKLSGSFENLVGDSQNDISSITNAETRPTTSSPVCDNTNNRWNSKFHDVPPNEVKNISSRTTREQILGITISDPTTTRKKVSQIQGVTVSDPATTKIPQYQKHVKEVEKNYRIAREQILGITISDPTTTREKVSQILGITVLDPSTTKKLILQYREDVNKVEKNSSRTTREQLLGITISDPTTTRKKLSQIQDISISDHVGISKKNLQGKTDWDISSYLEKITRNCIMENLIDANSTLLNIEDFDNGRVFKLETLKSDSREFKKVENLFKKTNRPCFVVQRIEKVNNPFLLLQYELKKMEYEKKEIAVEEMKMFHGTKQCNIESICTNNFNWRLKGMSRGHIFGQGVSFTPIANYATHYGDKTHNKVMVLVKVLVGKTCQGQKNMFIPPEDNDTSTNGKKVYVKYDDNTFYPEYLIYYCGVDDKIKENKPKLCTEDEPKLHSEDEPKLHSEDEPKLHSEDEPILSFNFDNPLPTLDIDYPNPIESFNTQISIPEVPPNKYKWKLSQPHLGVVNPNMSIPKVPYPRIHRPVNNNIYKWKLSQPQLGVLNPNMSIPKVPYPRVHRPENNMYMPKLPHLDIHRREPPRFPGGVYHSSLNHRHQAFRTRTFNSNHFNRRTFF